MPNRPPPQNDLTLLLPAYQPKVSALLEALIARGEKPRLFETYRNDARCLWAKSTKASQSGLMSMHRFRAAVDIIDAEHMWDNPDFFIALGEEAKKLKLTWGGDWDSNPLTHQEFNDRPHVQAIPLWRQDIFRSLVSDEARNAYLIRFFAGQR